jgi:hypothetical protein
MRVDQGLSMAMVGLPPVLGDTMEQGIFGCKRRNVTLYSSLYLIDDHVVCIFVFNVRR